MNATEKESIKKPYHSPKFFVYGDIRKLTESGSTMGAGDGGSAYSNKTGG
jgi:hypothetical protein